jgi:mxaC protein
LDYFRDRPLTASRVVLLVSDGGATINAANRAKLTDLFAARRASLIWIYTRGEQEPSIRVPQAFASESLSMHEFFASLGSPYQMFEVTSAEGLERAIAEVGRLTNLPTRYEQHLPRKDLAAPLFALALLCILALIGARLLEVRTWQA